MYDKLLKKKETGFTIIEVLIVLAIAGLILVVVLIAIPQLQRNQRNTARQNDASRVATSVSNWIANHNGETFTATALPDVRLDVGNLNQYALTEIVHGAATASTDVGAVDNLTTLRIVTSASCDNVSGDADFASARVFTVQYGIETSAATTGSCVDV